MITAIDYDSEGRAYRCYVAPNPPPQRRFLSCVICGCLVLIELTDPWPRYVSYWQPPRRGKQAGLCVTCFPDGPEVADPFEDSGFPFDAPGEETMKTTVVNVRREECEVYIGREHPRFPAGSPYGNPFHVGRDGTRAEVIEKYRAWLIDHPALLSLAKEELKGRRLGCWCKEKNREVACHGDVLVELCDAGD